MKFRPLGTQPGLVPPSTEAFVDDLIQQLPPIPISPDVARLLEADRHVLCRLLEWKVRAVNLWLDRAHNTVSVVGRESLSLTLPDVLTLDGLQRLATAPDTLLIPARTYVAHDTRTEMRSVALPLDLAMRLTTEERVKEIWVRWGVQTVAVGLTISAPCAMGRVFVWGPPKGVAHAQHFLVASKRYPARSLRIEILGLVNYVVGGSLLPGNALPLRTVTIPAAKTYPIENQYFGPTMAYQLPERYLTALVNLPAVAHQPQLQHDNTGPGIFGGAMGQGVMPSSPVAQPPPPLYMPHDANEVAAYNGGPSYHASQYPVNVQPQTYGGFELGGGGGDLGWTGQHMGMQSNNDPVAPYANPIYSPLPLTPSYARPLTTPQPTHVFNQGAGYNQQHVGMDQSSNVPAPVFGNPPPVNAQPYPYPPHTIERRGI